MPGGSNFHKKGCRCHACSSKVTGKKALISLRIREDMVKSMDLHRKERKLSRADYVHVALTELEHRPQASSDNVRYLNDPLTLYLAPGTLEILKRRVRGNSTPERVIEIAVDELERQLQEGNYTS